MKLPCDGQRAEKGKTRKREKGEREKVRLGSDSRTKILKGGPARSVRLNLLVL